MKRIFLITILIAGLAAAYGFAQMGGGMMGGEKGQHESMMSGEQSQSGHEMMQHKGMMSHGDMTVGMMDMTNQMSGMMGSMSAMMRDMPKENMKKMSGLMKDMCSEMTKLSGMMDSGMTTDTEMNRMHERMEDMQKRISEIK